MQSYLRGSMLTTAQRDVLDGFIGNEGIYFETIRDYDGVDWGTKALYLERAVSQNCQSFLQSLDKLYQPALVGNAKTAHLDFIRALKVVNDLCFNNPVKYRDYGTRDALEHFFGGLLEAVTSAIAMDFKAAIQSIINPKLVALTAEHLEVKLQRQARIAAEASIVGQTGWRTELDLPETQLPIIPQQAVDAVNPNVFFHAAAPAHGANVVSPQIIQNALNLGGGLFTAADLVGQDGPTINKILQPHVLQALQDRVFTLAQVPKVNNNRDMVLNFFNPECVQAIRDGLFTAADLVGQDGPTINKILQPHVLQALQDGVFTLPQVPKVNNKMNLSFFIAENIQTMRNSSSYLQNHRM